jgi:hypothetical protein
MGGHPSPEIPCKLCSKPVDLSADLSRSNMTATMAAD